MYVLNSPTNAIDPSGYQLIVIGQEKDKVLAVLRDELGMKGHNSTPTAHPLPGNPDAFLIHPGANFDRALLGNRDREKAWAPEFERAHGASNIAKEMFYTIGNGADMDLIVWLDAGGLQWEKATPNGARELDISYAYGLATYESMKAFFEGLPPELRPATADEWAGSRRHTWREQPAVPERPQMSARTPADEEFSRLYRAELRKAEKRERDRAFLQRSASQAIPSYTPDSQLLERVWQRDIAEARETWHRLSATEQFTLTLSKQAALFLATGPAAEW